jgi:hypothetical protein
MKNLIILAVALLCCHTVNAQQTASLKLNLEKNKVYHLRKVTQQNIVQSMNGMEQTTSVNNTSAVSIKMIEQTPDFLVTEVRFDTIITKTSAMGQNFTFNSTNPGNIKSDKVNEVMDCLMNRYCATPLFVKITPTGKVLEIINLKLFSTNVLKDVDSIKGQTAMMVKNQSKGLTDAKTLTTSIESFTNYLPGKDVSVGNSWENVVNTNSGGMSLAVTSKFQLNDIKGNNAFISGDSKIAPAGSEPMEINGMKIFYDLAGTSKATIELNTKSGLVNKSSEKNHMEGTMKIEMPGNSMSIPVKVDGETSTVSF